DEVPIRLDREQQADGSVDPGARGREAPSKLALRERLTPVDPVVRPGPLELVQLVQLPGPERPEQDAITPELNAHLGDPPIHGGRKTLRRGTICPSRCSVVSSASRSCASSSRILARSAASSACISMIRLTPARLIPRSWVISWICLSRSMSRSEYRRVFPD